MKNNLIQFRGITSRPVIWYGVELGSVAGMLFTDIDGAEHFCPLHGEASSLDDSLRILLETAHEIADKQHRNELCQQAAELASVRPRSFRVDDRISPMDPPDDEDDDRITAPMDGDPDMEDDNLPF